MPNLMYRNKPAISFTDVRKITPAEAIGYGTEYLKQYNTFGPRDLENLERYFQMKLVRKNDFFFRENEVVDEIGFIVKGAIKQYRRENGQQHIVYLLTEANMVSANQSWFYRKSTDHNALCVEDTLLLTINHEAVKRLVMERPAFLLFFADLTAEICMFYEQRMYSFQLMDAQKRYDSLLEKKPEYFNRFTMQDIANYIGIKPETLSRIRSMSVKKAS